MVIGEESFDKTFWLSMYGRRTSGMTTVPFYIQLQYTKTKHIFPNIGFIPPTVVNAHDE